MAAYFVLYSAEICRKTTGCFLKCFTENDDSKICCKYTPWKNGEFPLKVRICKDRKSRYISLGISVKPQHWDFKRNEPNEKCPNKEIVEKLIANKICEAKSEIVKLKASDTEFTATSLLHHLEREERIMSVADVFLQHINFLQYMKRTGYMLSVKQTFNSLVKYCGSLDMPFSDIGVGWLSKYELWLRKQEISENTIGIRFRNLRMIYNLAITQGYAKKGNYPFETFKVFIGFKNMVCCNLCVNTDGFKSELKVMDATSLFNAAVALFQDYNMAKHLYEIGALKENYMSEHQFAQFLGKSRMYQFLPSSQKKSLPQMLLTDTQIGMIAKAYYADQVWGGRSSRIE